MLLKLCDNVTVLVLLKVGEPRIMLLTVHYGSEDGVVMCQVGGMQLNSVLFFHDIKQGIFTKACYCKFVRLKVCFLYCVVIFILNFQLCCVDSVAMCE